MHQEYDETLAKDACPLCGFRAMRGMNFDTDSWSYICAICGIFRITEEFLLEIPTTESATGKLLYKLSYQFRQASQDVRKPADLPVHYASEMPNLLRSPDLSVEKKLETLLILLGRASNHPGEKIDFDYSTDYPLICAKNKEEALFLLQALESQELISLGMYTLNTQFVACTLKTQGWLKIEAINRSGGDSSDAFIAMWFHNGRAEYDQAITMAVKTAGYEPIRIDRVEHINRIDDEIIARIRRSRFLVADFTGQRNGVYFEAGFMLGLGRPVIWLCEKTDLVNVHFDTRQYNTIDYINALDLQMRLQVRIEAIMGKGPLNFTN